MKYGVAHWYEAMALVTFELSNLKYLTAAGDKIMKKHTTPIAQSQAIYTILYARHLTAILSPNRTNSSVFRCQSRSDTTISWNLPDLGVEKGINAKKTALGSSFTSKQSNNLIV